MATMQCDVVSVKESIYSGAVTMLIAKVQVVNLVFCLVTLHL